MAAKRPQIDANGLRRIALRELQSCWHLVHFGCNDPGGVETQFSLTIPAYDGFFAHDLSTEGTLPPSGAMPSRRACSWRLASAVGKRATASANGPNRMPSRDQWKPLRPLAEACSR
jgi:hypothetical protein